MTAPLVTQHAIRLRGPWEFLRLSTPAGATTGPVSGPVRMPASWDDAFGGRVGSVRLTRRFGCPSGLEGDERVWLEVAAAGEAAVLLDGEWLGTSAGPAVRFDVTERLVERHRLDIDVTPGEGRPGDESRPVVEVALVIVADAAGDAIRPPSASP